MADSYESTNAKMISDNRIDELLSGITVAEEEYNSLLSEFNLLVNSKEGDIASPVRLLELNNLIPKAKQSLDVKKEEYEKYIQEVSKTAPMGTNESLYIDTEDTFQTQASSKNESKPKWFQFGQRLKNWRNQKN